MEIWGDFIYYAAFVSIMLFVSSLLVYFRKTVVFVLPLQVLALLLMLGFIVQLWSNLSYPPMRTMGETRLWYSLFLIFAGIFTYIRYKFKWILFFTALLSTVFNLINVFKPEIHSEGLMPVLRSIWFIPHVSIYMFSYAIFAFAFLLTIISMFKTDSEYRSSIDELVLLGVGFFGFGMFVGALWAKQAWGNYWTWDPKETWAVVTWSFYVLYIHTRLQRKQSLGISNLFLILAFISLQMCWYGLNFLPNVESVHVYN